MATDAAPATDASAPAQPTIADTIRGYAARFMADPLNRERWKQALSPEAIAANRALIDKVTSYIPVPQSIRDHAMDIEDLAQDSANAALSKDPATALKAQAGSMWRGVNQAAAGFDQGVLNTVGPVLDAATAPSRAIMRGLNYLGGTDKPQAPTPSEFLQKQFIDPTGQPTTRGQKLMRAGGNAVGQSIPAMATGLGAAASGIRSGVTAAEQAANGLLDSVEPPAATSTSLSDTLRSVAQNTQGWVRNNVPGASTYLDAHASLVPDFAKNYIAAKASNLADGAAKVIDAMSPTNIQSRVQNVANALNPTNVAAAFNPANLQGAADTTLDFAARNPQLVAQANAARAFHTGVKNERAQLNQQQQQPADAMSPY